MRSKGTALAMVLAVALGLLTPRAHAQAEAEPPPTRVELVVCDSLGLRPDDVRSEAYAEFGDRTSCGDPRTWGVELTACAPSQRYATVRVARDGEQVESRIDLGGEPAADRARVLVLAAEPLTHHCVRPAEPLPEPAAPADVAVDTTPVDTPPEVGASAEPSQVDEAPDVGARPRPWSIDVGVGAAVFVRGTSPLFGVLAGLSFEAAGFRYRAALAGSYTFLSSELAFVHALGLGADLSVVWTAPVGGVRLGLGGALHAGFVTTTTSRREDTVIVDDGTLPLVVLSLPLVLEIPVGTTSVGVELAPGVSVVGASLRVPEQSVDLRGFVLAARLLARF
jgi:hypothetical protein